ncbi:unnamed protein product [Peronospora belbahrii]|uniref:Uncharacterized protein n=1 Tax=Peronospora belbahrii TaxID=622444 RepID=A0AAU9L1X8_9STRA|nr:unnamed protein product [Peronospora belbahrii]
METTLRLTANDMDTAQRKQKPGHGKVFPFRELIGSLMYLATCTGSIRLMLLDSLADTYNNQPNSTSGVPYRGHHDVEVLWHNQLLKQSMLQHVKHAWQGQAFVMSTNPTYSRRTRHIVLRWHYVWDQVAKRTVELWKIKTKINPSDLMTKPLASGRLKKLKGMIGMTKNHVPKGLPSEEGVLE